MSGLFLMCGRAVRVFVIDVPHMANVLSLANVVAFLERTASSYCCDLFQERYRNHYHTALSITKILLLATAATPREYGTEMPCFASSHIIETVL